MTTSSAARRGGAASGTDTTGTITVAVDEDGLVQDVSVTTLPEELRDTGRLTAAFAEALTRAYANGYPAAEPPAGEEIVRARVPQRPPRVPMRQLVEQALRAAPHATAAGRTRPIGGEIGTSRNGCVSVELDRTGPTGTPTFDQAWLGQATGKNVAAAIREAFADAYETRSTR